MMSTVTPRPPLPRWVWITIAAVVAAAVVIGVVVWAQQPTDDATPSVTPQPSATSGASGDVVTGCLAEGQDIDMLLTTQEAAAHTKEGAAEYATAVIRWSNRWPWPDAAEVEAAYAARSTGSTGEFDQAQYDALVAGPNASGGIVAEGTPFHMSAVVGKWYVDSYDGDTAQVTVGLAFVIGEAVSPLYRSAATLELKWTEAGWVTEGVSKKHTVEETFELGAPYAGGC